MKLFDLSAVRKKTGKSQQVFSGDIGISRQYYNYIERGVRLPSVKVAKKIASALDFDWTLFFEDSKDVS
mgnify:FL=1